MDTLRTPSPIRYDGYDRPTGISKGAHVSLVPPYVPTASIYLRKNYLEFVWYFFCSSAWFKGLRGYDDTQTILVSAECKLSLIHI